MSSNQTLARKRSDLSDQGVPITFIESDKSTFLWSNKFFSIEKVTDYGEIFLIDENGNRIVGYSIDFEFKEQENDT